MIHKRESIVKLLETLSTALFVYLLWVGLFNLLQARNMPNFNILLGLLFFFVYFILLLASSSIVYLHMNPFLTASLYIFNLIKYKNVS